MAGNTVGTLNVYASGTGNNELETNPIWSISGEQGDQWIQGEVLLSSEVPYSVICCFCFALGLKFVPQKVFRPRVFMSLLCLIAGVYIFVGIGISIKIISI